MSRLGGSVAALLARQVGAKLQDLGLVLARLRRGTTSRSPGLRSERAWNS